MTSVDYGKKKEPQRAKVLRLLSDLEWHHHNEMLKVGGGVRYSARLLELKRLGYRITTIENEDGDGKSYKLLSLFKSEPQPKKVKIFLDETDAENLLKLGSFLSPVGLEEVRKSLESYLANKERL